jgi:acetoacetate decarboxylase
VTASRTARRPIIIDRSEALRLLSAPVSAPAYTPSLYRFTNREYLSIKYRTDPTKLHRVVPEPLKVREPLVRYEVMRMSDATRVAT